MIRIIVTAAALIAGAAMPALSEPLAKDIFGHFRGASAGAPIAIGTYSRGCAQGLEQLPESGPSWQAMRLSRDRSWGHPDLIRFLGGLSNAAQQAGWKGLYIGDISQPRGGPTLSGHASHQLGLDADIWMLPPPSLSLSRAEREKISSVSVVNQRGTALSNHWTPGHMAIIRAAARDDRVQRIFVDPVVKATMCRAETGNRDYLRKIQVMNGHNYHFHVRLRCPKGSSLCTGQKDVPRGDHCDAAEEMIRVRIDPSRAKPGRPNPDYRHPRTYRLSDLPPQCRTVATAP